MYKIVRSYNPSLNKPDELIATDLTLEEAQAHCQDPTTREAGVWFDGYQEEEFKRKHDGGIFNTFRRLKLDGSL